MNEQLLVVEDDLVLQLSLTAMLRSEGFGLLAAGSLAEARAQLTRERPMVLLLDLSLPDGSGFELLEQLSAAQDGPLVIVSTASDALATAVEALRLGAFDYLTKPINHDLLRAAVRRALECHRLQEAAREVERLRAHEEAMRATARAAAHHISQHLTVIMGETQLLQEELPDPRAHDGLERILRATEQAAQTLSELRAARHFVVRDASAPRGMILDLDAAKEQDEGPIG